MGEQVRDLYTAEVVRAEYINTGEVVWIDGCWQNVMHVNNTSDDGAIYLHTYSVNRALTVHRCKGDYLRLVDEQVVVEDNILVEQLDEETVDEVLGPCPIQQQEMAAEEAFERRLGVGPVYETVVSVEDYWYYEWGG